MFYNDLEQIPEEKLSTARLEVLPMIISSNGQSQQATIVYEEIPEDGVIKVEIDMPAKAKFMLLKVRIM